MHDICDNPFCNGCQQRKRWREQSEIQDKVSKIPLKEKVEAIINGTRTGDVVVCNCGRALRLDCESIACSAAQHKAYDYLKEYIKNAM